MRSISSSGFGVAKLFLLVALCAVLLPVPGSSQVTFSRDWNAGKRAMPDSGMNGVTECSAIWRSVNNLCAAVTFGAGWKNGALLPCVRTINTMMSSFWCYASLRKG